MLEGMLWGDWSRAACRLFPEFCCNQAASSKSAERSWCGLTVLKTCIPSTGHQGGDSSGCIEVYACRAWSSPPPYCCCTEAATCLFEVYWKCDTAIHPPTLKQIAWTVLELCKTHFIVRFGHFNCTKRKTAVKWWGSLFIKWKNSFNRLSHNIKIALENFFLH